MAVVYMVDRKKPYQMKRYLVIVSCMFIFLTGSVSEGAEKINAKKSITVKSVSKGQHISINAHNVPLQDILHELADTCNIKVVLHERDIAAQPVTIYFDDLEIKQGLRKLVLAAGITNYIINSKDNRKHGSEVTELIIIGTKARGSAIVFEAGAGSIEPSGVKEEEKKIEDKKIEDKINHTDDLPKDPESFKSRYTWTSEQTQELAGSLLDCIPDPAGNPGLTELSRALDKRLKMEKKDTVDEQMLFNSIQSIMPPHIAPKVMESLKRYSQNNGNGRSLQMDMKSIREKHQKMFDKMR